MSIIKYTIFYNEELSKAETIKKHLQNFLDQNWIETNQLHDAEYVFVVGGDGTFLKHFENYQNKKVIAINAGNLGYYSHFNKNNLKLLKTKIKNENNFNNVMVLQICLNNEVLYYCLNEVIIRCDKTFESNIYINNVLLEKFKGSGVLICTPMGSTAHNKNAHGSIIYPGISAIQIVELEPITQKRYMTLKSPLVIPSDFHITLKSTKELENTKIIIDGKPIKINFNGILKIKSVSSNFKLFNPYEPKSYIKKLRDSFIREK